MLENLNVRDKKIIITGAAGILGTVYAEGFSAQGADVVIVDLDGMLCQKKAREIGKKYGTRPLGIGSDITSKKAVAAMVQKVMSEYGRIDVLVNNAATKSENFFAPFEEFPLADWDKVMGVNVNGMFLCCQAVAGEMEKSKAGSIINISSIYGVVAPDQRIYQGSLYKGKGINTPLIYSASKGAVISLTRYLSTYLAPYNIRVNAVTPGGVFSGQNKTFVRKYSERCPLGRMAKPEEIFSAVYFLASDASSYVTGHNLIVDGGWSVW
jgi:NAD(P)-dependent dehydrogenase (short-subunit alcohol dehydrogenase family)